MTDVAPQRNKLRPLLPDSRYRRRWTDPNLLPPMTPPTTIRDPTPDDRVPAPQPHHFSHDV